MNSYEIFCKTVELGSLSHAAEALSYSQSNITHTIQQLEKEYGFKLLIRNKAGVSLTDNGAILYEKMKQVLAAEHELKNCVDEINGYTMGSLKIGVFSSIAAEILPKVLKTYNEKYPNVEITLYDGDHKAVVDWLMDGTVDIGFLSQIPDINIKFISLLQDEMLAVLPENHVMRKVKEIPVSYFAEEPTIYPYKSISHDVDVIMKKANVEPNTIMEIRGGETVAAMVREGLGISILPELYIRTHKEGIVAKPLNPREFRTIGMAISPKTTNEILTERFLEIVTETLDKDE